MGLARTNLLGQISNATGTFGSGNFVTSAFTPPDNSLLVVAIEGIENGGSTSLEGDLAVSGAGLTYTSRIQIGVATSFSTGVRIFTAPIITGASMSLTISCNGRSMTEYAVSVVAYTGYAVSTPVGTSGTSSQNGGFGSAPNPASLTLGAAPASTSEVFAMVGADKRTADITPGSTLTEVHDVINTDWGGAETEVRTGSTSTTVDWVDLRPNGGALFNYAAAAIEIIAAPVEIDPTGIAVPVALGQPTVSIPSATPNGLAVPVSFGQPTLTLPPGSPNGLAVPVSFGQPTLTLPVVTPLGLAVPVSLGGQRDLSVAVGKPFSAWVAEEPSPRWSSETPRT